MTENRLRRLQMIEVEILDEFVRICEKYRLTYYLYFGTLLGAVRHKGFIPWDDDMDVVMPRKDYNRFCEVAAREIGPQFFAQNNRTDPGYPADGLRIRKKNTKYVSDYMSRLELKEYGIWLDVVPIENVSSPKSFKLFLNAYLNREIIYRLAGHRAVKNSKGRSLPHRAVEYASRILPLRAWVHLSDWMYQLDRNDASELCIVYLGPYPWRRTLMPRKVYGEPVKLEFEGKLYNAPRDWDYVLRSIYGDYMQMPPLEKRTAHAPAIWEM